MALVAIERGISTQQLERFYYVKRKGAKTRYFDHRAFAEKYDISIDWIFAGFICEHPRGLDVVPPGHGVQSGVSMKLTLAMACTRVSTAGRYACVRRAMAAIMRSFWRTA